jgi:prevent-host-death family protein
MTTKAVSSTKAQNNFGQVLDDVMRNHTRYVIERHGIPQAILVSLDDFAQVLNDENKRREINSLVKEIRPKYHLGQVVEPID